METNFPKALTASDLESLTLDQTVRWFYLRLHGRDHFPRANPRLEEQESDLLLDAYRQPDLGRETKRRFRLAAVRCMEQAVTFPADGEWSAEAIEDLCCALPALVYEEEEEDRIAPLLLRAAERWPWVTDSRIRLKRQALLTLGDLSWRLVRTPRPPLAFWERIWTQEAVEERNGKTMDYIGEAAGAIFSGIELSEGFDAALRWLGKTRWRGGYNADLLRKLIPSRKQKLGPDTLMKHIHDSLLPAMGGNDSKEDALIQAMEAAEISPNADFFEWLLEIKSANERASETLHQQQIIEELRSISNINISIDIIEFVLYSLMNYHEPSAWTAEDTRHLEFTGNAIRNLFGRGKIKPHTFAFFGLILSREVASARQHGIISAKHGLSVAQEAVKIYHAVT